ncbi:MAG: hypothetical protein CMJ81_16210 [Planctomycetaceae bacterium]|jgi:hypothetical protein|nr:hypothetical protein [Planctomycetaceae bacterium]MBP63819.1 hypothetical protein [Planctomycetaceae bacterium]
MIREETIDFRQFVQPLLPLQQLPSKSGIDFPKPRDFGGICSKSPEGITDLMTILPFLNACVFASADGDPHQHNVETASVVSRVQGGTRYDWSFQSFFDH